LRSASAIVTAPREPDRREGHVDYYDALPGELQQIPGEAVYIVARAVIHSDDRQHHLDVQVRVTAPALKDLQRAMAVQHGRLALEAEVKRLGHEARSLTESRQIVVYLF
jgi:hypothetical protein